MCTTVFVMIQGTCNCGTVPSLTWVRATFPSPKISINGTWGSFPAPCAIVCTGRSLLIIVPDFSRPNCQVRHFLTSGWPLWSISPRAQGIPGCRPPAPAACRAVKRTGWNTCPARGVVVGAFITLLKSQKYLTHPSRFMKYINHFPK